MTLTQVEQAASSAAATSSPDKTITLRTSGASSTLMYPVPVGRIFLCKIGHNYSNNSSNYKMTVAAAGLSVSDGVEINSNFFTRSYSYTDMQGGRIELSPGDKVFGANNNAPTSFILGIESDV